MRKRTEEKGISNVSAILGPIPYTGKVDSEQETVVIKGKRVELQFRKRGLHSCLSGTSITAM